MLYKLHYCFASAGENALTILIGVFMQTYTDGSTTEIGALLMMMSFLGLFARPIICSIADRHQAHQKCLIYCLLFVALSYFPFIVVPLSGPELYERYPRLCWWSLVTLKIIGDIAFGGVISIADSLAVNYSKRVGDNFGTYRICATLSWMFFGFFTGQVNEVPFLPKYVPGFMILCAFSLLDSFVCWLWPPEFFQMVAIKHTDDDISSTGSLEQKKHKKAEELMSDADLRWHMKVKLKSLIPCWRTQEEKYSDIAMEAIANLDSICSTAAEQENRVGKRTQLLILATLFRRDPRLILYLMFFVCAGATLVPVSFFYMSLSEICNQQGTCNFSQLGGYLQVSSASLETILFAYISHILTFTGRVNMCACSLAIASFKFLFYGTVWGQLNPLWSLVIEPLHGFCYVCTVTLMVELGHKFANEVEYIIPQMVERGIIKSDVSVDKVRLSLSATMLAVISVALDGIGRGFGALIYGIILAHYNYESLWLIIGIFAGLASLTAFAISVFDRTFDPQLGLDVRAKRRNYEERRQHQPEDG